MKIQISQKEQFSFTYKGQKLLQNLKFNKYNEAAVTCLRYTCFPGLESPDKLSSLNMAFPRGCRVSIYKGYVFLTKILYRVYPFT